MPVIKASSFLKYLFSLIGILYFYQHSPAQTYNFRNYSVEDGLPFVQVYTIFQDSRGNLWCGGYGGLSRFDGVRFTNYSTKDGLLNHWVTSIAEDKLGNLWIGTIKGISKFNGTRFINYTTKQGLVDNYVNTVITDKKGNIWIGTKNGMSKYNGKSFVNFTSNSVLTLFIDKNETLWMGTEQGVITFDGKDFKTFSVNSGLCCNAIKAIVQCDEGAIWVGTDHGLNKYINGTFTNYTTEHGLQSNEITTLIKDNNNNIWVGTRAGIHRYDGKGFKNYKIGKNSNSNLIKSLFKDHEGSIWIGTRTGLYKYRGEAFITYTEQDGLNNSFIFQIFRDSKSRLWICSGDGVHRFKQDKFDVLSTEDGLISNYVWSGMEDQKGRLWFGTNRGLSIYDGYTFKSYTKADGLASDSVICIFKARNGDIWLGGNGGVTRYDGKKFIPLKLRSPSSDVWTIYEDSKGSVWIGAYQGGLYKYDGTALTNLSQKYKSDAYLSITEDREGNLYFGSFDGVFMYDGKKIIQFSTHDGLSSDLVYSLIFDPDEKNLWVGTNQGVNKIDIDKFKRTGQKQIISYGKEEGFLGVECNSNGVFRDTDSSIWFGTVNGLIRYNAKEYHPNTVESKTNITGFQLFYKDTLLAPNIRLSYDQNHISFKYIGICLSNPSDVRYIHTLEGFENEWSPVNKDNFITYSNLPPGTYTFKVKSCNNEGKWNMEPAMFTFTILSPFWKTWWFLSLAAVGLVTAITWGFRYRVQKLKLQQRVVENELKALRAQMNPHFLFNSLNSIQHFIISNDEISASKYLNKFAKLIRLTLNNSERATVSLKEELEALNLYLELESLRFENKFTYNIEVDAAIDKDFYQIPAMLIQPYVENAILHGLMPKESKGHLQIKLQLDKSHIICVVTDNGVGRRKSMQFKQYEDRNHRSMGMKITRDRLEVLNYIHHSRLSVMITDIELENPSAFGTKVEIYIPILN